VVDWKRSYYYYKEWEATAKGESILETGSLRLLMLRTRNCKYYCIYEGRDLRDTIITTNILEGNVIPELR
jgi:hypothetical protein